MDWFNSANFGIFLHWGIYSVDSLAFDIDSQRQIGNGSEWYLGRLLKNYRENKADKAAKEHHLTLKSDTDMKSYKSIYESYCSFRDDFDGKNFDADKWCCVFEKLGAKYIVITAKHHDGFCLFETKTTDNNIMNTPLKKDVIKELKESCKKYNLKFGIYYSLMEFVHPFGLKNSYTTSVTNNYITNILYPQLKELEKYEPDLWWMDGNWLFKSKNVDLTSFLKRIHKRGSIINNRLPPGYKGDYNNFEDRHIPSIEKKEKWEHCNTIGKSWGYNKYQEKYKTAKELYKIYKEVVSKNGNFLLNLGPKANGSFDKNEFKIICEFTYYMKNGI